MAGWLFVLATLAHRHTPQTHVAWPIFSCLCDTGQNAQKKKKNLPTDCVEHSILSLFLHTSVKNTMAGKVNSVTMSGMGAAPHQQILSMACVYV